MKNDLKDGNNERDIKTEDIDVFGDEKMERKLPYYIGAFLVLFALLVKTMVWDLFHMTTEEIYDMSVRSLLLIIGIIALDLGNEAATKYRKRSKTIGAVVGFSIGVLAILYALGIISFSSLGW